MPATYEKIATTTLGSAQASFNLNSIPGTFTDLRLVVSGTNVSANQDVAIRFNSDTGSNYSFTILNGSGSAASSSRVTSATNIQLNAGAGISATIPYFASVDVFSYAGGTNKTTLQTMNNDQNGSGGIQAIVGLWRNTSAITSITILGVGSNLNTGTTATLYGIAKA